MRRDLAILVTTPSNVARVLELAEAFDAQVFIVPERFVRAARRFRVGLVDAPPEAIADVVREARDAAPSTWLIAVLPPGSEALEVALRGMGIVHVARAGMDEGALRSIIHRARAAEGFSHGT